MKFKNTTRSTSRLSRGYVARFEPASRAPAVPDCRPSSDLFFSHQIHQYSPHRGQNTHVFDQFHLRPPYHSILLSFSTTSIRNTSSFVYAHSHTYAFPHPHHSPHKHAKRSPSFSHSRISLQLPSSSAHLHNHIQHVCYSIHNTTITFFPTFSNTLVIAHQPHNSPSFPFHYPFILIYDSTTHIKHIHSNTHTSLLHSHDYHAHSIRYPSRFRSSSPDCISNSHPNSASTLPTTHT